MRGTVVSQHFVSGCPDLQNEVNKLLQAAEAACGTDRVVLTCIDMEAEPPHHTRSHLGGSVAQMAAATLEFLHTSHQRMACILVLGDQKITVEKTPHGYRVTALSVEEASPVVSERVGQINYGAIA